MCKHCNNVETIHFNMQGLKHFAAGTPEDQRMDREYFDEMDSVAIDGAMAFAQEVKEKGVHPGKVACFSFTTEQNAIAYMYYYEKPKDMQVQLDLLKEVEALRAALTLVQTRLVLTDNDSLKSTIDDALANHNPKLNSADLAKEIQQIKEKAKSATAHRFN